jgi:hypothetical protein
MYTTYHVRYRYRPELFDILGGQPTELTLPTLLLRIIEYVSRRGLAHYSAGSAWLDATDTGLCELLGIQGPVNRFVMWDDGQRIAGWREVIETVQERWMISTPQEVSDQLIDNAPTQAVQN